ncbi:MFS transporter [Marinimicrococcus flavescens]|uniref:MFS transporter n=1 Tax=Marinimicrococcus flavescens TaxID=3031815 RepID=A0AAP3UZL8_9PROT|nr:MFS transporter [Marinimicrococcus flavescens]
MAAGLKADSAWAAFRHRDFAFFCAARFLSGVGIQMLNVAVGWLVYELTGSALALGMVGLAAFLPVVSLALFAGHVADRHDRRRILVAAYGTVAAAASALVLYLLAGGTAVWPLFLAVTAMGSARAFANPASQALVPNLVPAHHFGNAIAWNSSTWQTATIIGPALGGGLYIFGAPTVFAAAAGALALTALLLAAVRHRPAMRPREPASWASLLAGLVFIRSQQVMLGAISLDLVAVLLGGATALLPIFAEEILAVGPAGLGLLRSMPAAGAALMALLLAWRPIRRRAGRKMLLAVAVFGLATVGFGLSETLWLSLLCLLVLGAADMVSVFVRQTLVQLETPDAMRGRVAAVNSVFIGASNELGEFESGTLAALVGAVGAVVIGGAGSVAAAAYWAWRFPALRERDELIRQER